MEIYSTLQMTSAYWIFHNYHYKPETLTYFLVSLTAHSYPSENYVMLGAQHGLIIIMSPSTTIIKYYFTAPAISALGSGAFHSPLQPYHPFCPCHNNVIVSITHAILPT